MRVRALDEVNDWTFGKGANDYKVNRRAVAQNIQTRLSSFLGDCFFDQTAGIDWFNLLGSKQRLALELAISSVILNTADVTGMVELESELNPTTRNLRVRYTVQTAYSVQPLSDTFVFELI